MSWGRQVEGEGGTKPPGFDILCGGGVGREKVEGWGGFGGQTGLTPFYLIRGGLDFILG